MRIINADCHAVIYSMNPDPDNLRVNQPAWAGVPLIAVCVATYRRPALLRRLLDSFTGLALPAGYRVELRVVDNDPEGASRGIVESHPCQERVCVRYGVQPKRNIALTRNMALDMGAADLLAFVDDDEAPATEWLVELVRALGDGVDIAIGDVVPSFEVAPQLWVERGRFHYKDSGTGSAMGWRGARTSNAMIRGRYVYDFGFRFDPEYGQTGGEDTDFFMRVMMSGARMEAAPLAIVVEHVHRSQLRFSWLARRFWRCGINYERIMSRAGGRHPLLRFGRRLVRGVLFLVGAMPLLLAGRAEYAARALLDLSRAGGGLAGWLRPEWSAKSGGYPSSGVLEGKS